VQSEKEAEEGAQAESMGLAQFSAEAGAGGEGQGTQLVGNGPPTLSGLVPHPGAIVQAGSSGAAFQSGGARLAGEGTVQNGMEAGAHEISVPAHVPEMKADVGQHVRHLHDAAVFGQAQPKVTVLDAG
jgi:hypothetical protein